jgi:hypothetical protein
VTSPTRRPWSLFPTEFHCRGCGAQEAYRSRPRGFFETYVLPVFFLQTVRCDQCYLRSYIPRSVPAKERAPFERLQPKGQPTASSNRDSRIA